MVIVPALIKHILDQQDLSITGGALQILSPTQLNMSIITSLDTPLPARLDPLDLSLYNKETQPVSPFITLQLPGMSVSGKTPINVPMQTLTILNQTELVNWFNPFFENDKVGLSLRGDPRLHLGKLKYSSSLDKTVSAPALNYLDGMQLLSLRLNLNSNNSTESEKVKYNARGSLNIPNTGVLKLGMGNQTFNVWAGETRLGVINSYDVQLSPGDNALDFEGNLFFEELIPNLSTILDSQKEALSNGHLELFISGNATMVDGEHIPYVEKVMNTKRIRITVSVISVLADVVGGLLDTDQGSLMDIVGTAFGNSTLFENLLDNWKENDRGGDEDAATLMTRRKIKKRSWMFSLLKLGLRARRS